MAEEESTDELQEMKSAMSLGNYDLDYAKDAVTAPAMRRETNKHTACHRSDMSVEVLVGLCLILLKVLKEDIRRTVYMLDGWMGLDD